MVVEAAAFLPRPLGAVPSSRRTEGGMEEPALGLTYLQVKTQHHYKSTPFDVQIIEVILKTQT